jgi:hypothetical protein
VDHPSEKLSQNDSVSASTPLRPPPHQRRLPSAALYLGNILGSFRFRFLRNNENLIVARNAALEHIGQLLELSGKSLELYGLPVVVEYPREVLQELQRWGGRAEMLHERAMNAALEFNYEQRVFWETILLCVEAQHPHVAFLNGSAGRGKTFVIAAICDYLRSVGGIVLATATSAYAAQAYPGGRTTHSVFKVSETQHLASVTYVHAADSLGIGPSGRT